VALLGVALALLGVAFTCSAWPVAGSAWAGGCSGELIGLGR